MNRFLFALLICCISALGRVTYQVTENASFCSEVRIPKWTRPAAHIDDLWNIDSWGCQYDVRRQANTIYVGLSCGSTEYWRMQEKYAIDLSHPEQIRKTDQATWESASVLEPNDGGVFDRYLSQPTRSKDQGTLFPTSGPKWAGGRNSPGGTRIALDSWSGTIRDPPELMEYTGSFRQFIVDSIRARYNGRYWIDIYDAASARRLIQLRGEFHGDKPDYFQGKAKWLNGSLYVLPLEPRGMRRLLICDVDAAAKASGVAESDAAVPLERAKPYFNHSRSTYQMRFLDPETPQARITGFQDQPVYRPGTNQIETVKVTALLEVQTPGRYSLRLDLANMQEHGEADLDRGNARITIPFAAARLREGGVGGPFRITWAHLTRQVGDGQIEADNRHDASKFAGMNDSGQLTSDKYGDRIDAATQAYSLNSLGALLYFTGENSAAPTRGSGSEPDRLEVRIGLHAEDTDCRGYGFVNGAQASNGLVSGAADRKTLLMTFTGKGIVDSAGYRRQHVGVRCGGHWIQAASIDIPIGK